MTLKEQLHALCKAYIDARIQNAEQQIADAREAIGNETKSSAGDKYETAREMMQQDIDMATARMNDARQQLAVLDRIDTSAISEVIIPGSVVLTDNGNFYIATNAGQLKVEGVTYQSISFTSPIGQAMKGLSKGNRFTFNRKEYIIDNIE
ncbi:MAG: 3-oxoacyl-ACP synthase [Sphingobacteriales bacterium]|nr:MAG: 3-oxoacyl-ACP synthase [Sphingobacteriales bacterium]